jgi:hypothetical protein
VHGQVTSVSFAGFPYVKSSEVPDVCGFSIAVENRLCQLHVPPMFTLLPDKRKPLQSTRARIGNRMNCKDPESHGSCIRDFYTEASSAAVKNICQQGIQAIINRQAKDEAETKLKPSGTSCFCQLT